MKNKIWIYLVTAMFATRLQAQVTTGPGIAPFVITLTNGAVYKATLLKKNTATVLIYFAPDCDHCHAFVKELIKNDGLIKNKQVILITYFPMPAVVSFDKQYKLSAHPAVHVGTEGMTFIVQRYYNIQRFPFIVLYNRQGQEVKRFIQETPFPTIATALSALK